MRKYQTFDRTRLFGPEWKITSMWTTLDVAWSRDYHPTKFSFTLAKPRPVVIVLSQLDDRYFRGLEGRYKFGLGFRVHKAGEDDYIVRTHTTYYMKRSCNVELELEAGEYTVLVRIDAERYDDYLPPEDVVRLNVKNRREKLLRIGLAYDLAHSKARVVETAEEKAAREAYLKHRKEKHREFVRKVVMRGRESDNYRKRKQWHAHQKENQWRKELAKKRNEKIQAKRDAKQKAKEAAKAEAAAKAEETAKDEEAAPGQEGDKATEKPVEADAPTSSEEKTAPEPKEGEEQPKVEDIQAKTEEQQVKTETAESKEEETQIKTEDTESDEQKQIKAETAEPQGEEKQVKIEAADPEGSTDAPQDTPASTSQTVSSEPADAEAKSEAAAKTGETETAPAPAAETPSNDVPKQAEPAAEPNPEESASNARFEEKIRTALEVVSSFKKELEGLLGESADGINNTNNESDNGIPHPHGPPHVGGGGRPCHPRIIFNGDYPPHAPESTVGEDNNNNNNKSGDDMSDVSSISDICSVRSVSDVSETELDFIIREAEQRHGGGGGGGGPPLPGRAGLGLAPPPDRFERDPWNAVAVVGLRVYYKVAKEEGDKNGEGEEEGVKMKVVRPTRWEVGDEESEEEDGEEEGVGEIELEKEGGKGEGGDETQVLDVDDSAKDAVVIGLEKGQ